MFSFRITDVVKHLIIINVLVYIAAWMLLDDGRIILAFFYPSLEEFKPFQIISHMFMHGDEAHLFFNMFSLFFFGPLLESLWGPKRFLFYYLFAGFGALLLHLFVNYIEINYMGLRLIAPVWGASGAIFGVFIGCALKFPNNMVQLLIPPIPMKMKHMAMLFAGIDLFLGFSSFNTGIAHFAHLGGALFGFLLITYWDKFGSKL